MFRSNEIFNYKKEDVFVGKSVIVENFWKEGKLVVIYGKIKEIYNHHALVITKHYMTSVNFI